MADQEDDDDITPPKNNKMMMIIIAVNVVAVLGIGGFLAMGGSGGSADAAEPAAETAEPKLNPGAPPVLVPLEPFIVNLKEPGGTRYLKMVIEIEVPGPQGSTMLNERIPPVRDRVIAALSELSFTDTQGAERKRKIRKTLVKEINDELKTGLAQNVYFTEFVVQ